LPWGGNETTPSGKKPKPAPAPAEKSSAEDILEQVKRMAEDGGADP
jgi:hypothetical protein